MNFLKDAPARVVALLTPPLAALAGWVSVEATKLPGAPQLDRTQLTAVFVAGTASVVGIAWKWLDGQAYWELHQLAGSPVVERVAHAATVYADAHPGVVGPEVVAGLNALSERLDALEESAASVAKVQIDAAKKTASPVAAASAAGRARAKRASGRKVAVVTAPAEHEQPVAVPGSIV